eukprot:2571963-Pleurochrysis_carterae.AAC.1
MVAYRGGEGGLEESRQAGDGPCERSGQVLEGRLRANGRGWRRNWRWLPAFIRSLCGGSFQEV